MPGHIPPSVWGPFFWHTIHLVALGYPNAPTYSEKKAAKEFYESLQHLIPCPVCKLHYQAHIKELPLTPNIDSKKDLFKWTVDLHNRVNKDLGKPQYTELDAIEFYHSLGARGRSPVWTPQDVQAAQFEEMAKQLGILLAGGVLIGGAYWVYQTFFNKK
jgi:FAD-linked sulfhydryl oxidase